MVTVTDSGRQHVVPAYLLQSRALMCLAATLFAVALTVASDPFRIWMTLGDTDDATRLIQVKALLAGQGWFDLTFNQIGLPDALVSHWSRLVDAPLAVLLGAAQLFAPDAVADSIVRAIWPTALLFVMMWLVARETERLGGTEAVPFVLALAATSAYATFQFMPGRIDHHGLQIIGAAGGMIVLAGALLTGRGGLLAGGLFAMGLAIGYEAMPLVIAVLGLAVLFAAFDVRLLPPVADTLKAFAIGLALAFVITNAPSQWATAACDALGANLVAFAVVGAATLSVVATWGKGWSVWMRLAIMAVGGAAAAGIYVEIAPACIAGPMAAVDVAIKPIWLDHVKEGMSLFAFAVEKPAVALVYVVFMLSSVAIAAVDWSRQGGSARLFIVAMIGLATVYGGIFVKFFPYAMWVAMPLVAIWMSRLPGLGEVPARTIRLAALVGANHITALMLALAIVNVAAPRAVAGGDDDKKVSAGRCDKREDFRKLAKLAPGRIMNDIDLGPHIAAHSPHRVLAAPYHRLDKAIVLWDRISNGTPDIAERELRALAINYVVLCTKRMKTTNGPKSFAGILKSGGSVAYLEPVDVGEMIAPVRVWRVRPATAGDTAAKAPAGTSSATGAR